MPYAQDQQTEILIRTTYIHYQYHETLQLLSYNKLVKQKTKKLDAIKHYCHF
jgi:hypothetical protein